MCILGEAFELKSAPLPCHHSNCPRSSPSLFGNDGVIPSWMECRLFFPESNHNWKAPPRRHVRGLPNTSLSISTKLQICKAHWHRRWGMVVGREGTACFLDRIGSGTPQGRRLSRPLGPIPVDIAPLTLATTLTLSLTVGCSSFDTVQNSHGPPTHCNQREDMNMNLETFADNV